MEAVNAKTGSPPPGHMPKCLSCGEEQATCAVLIQHFETKKLERMELCDGCLHLACTTLAGARAERLT